MKTEKEMKDITFWRRSKVIEKTTLPKATLYQKIKDNEFPKAAMLGVRTPVWLENEVLAWMHQRIACRDKVASELTKKDSDPTSTTNNTTGGNENVI